MLTQSTNNQQHLHFEFNLEDLKTEADLYRSWKLTLLYKYKRTYRRSLMETSFPTKTTASKDEIGVFLETNNRCEIGNGCPHDTIF